MTKSELNPSSGMASKTDATNGDPKAERKKKKSSKENRVPKESQGALDGD